MNDNPSDQIIQNTMGHYLQMPYNRYLWLRLEFVAICGDEIEAKIMRIVEYDIEGARIAWFNNASALAANGKPYPPAPEQWWVTLSYKQIMAKMYGTVKNEKTIIAKLNSLIKEKKYLQKRTDPENPYGAPQYTINREVVQAKLDGLSPLPMVPDVAKLYSEISSDPVPAIGTPSNKEEGYQPVVPPVPASGTPRTSEWNSPVPATGTEGYQPVVHNNNNKKNTKNKNKNKEDSIPNEPATSTFVANATIPFVSSSDDLEQESSHIVIEATNENVEPKTTRNHQSLEQNPLFDATPKSPVMPLESAKWCAETVVQIVEFRRNKRFLEDARGKSQKSQRERQLDAAKKIIDAKITREEFIKAYDARNDAWWQDNRGDLTVVDMAAKTTKGVMRTLEVLENIDSKKGAKIQSNGHQAQPSQCNSILTQEEKDFRKWLVTQPQEERPKILKARREARLAAQVQA